MTKRLAISLFILMTAGMTSLPNLYAALTNTNTYKEIMNESYGTNPAQKVDVYLPAGRSIAATKVLVLLHGGAWNSGDKTSITDFVKLVQHKNPDLAILNANYRLISPSTHLPAQIADIQQLLEYISSKSANWSVGTSHISLGGISAGAHLAMLYAYKYDVTKKIDAVISIVGPTYFADTYYTGNALFQPVIINLLGKPVSDTTSYLQASPAYVVAAGAPPTYMAYGGYDPLVPVSNATFLDKKLTDLKVQHQYHFFPNEGHRFSLPTYNIVAQEIIAFLEKYSLSTSPIN